MKRSTRQPLGCATLPPNSLSRPESYIEGLVEASWRGGRYVGRVVIEMRDPDCEVRMTTHAQAGLPKDLTVLRTIVRDAGQNIGIYASARNLKAWL